jgi:hypothetical protein
MRRKGKVVNAWHRGLGLLLGLLLIAHAGALHGQGRFRVLDPTPVAEEEEPGLTVQEALGQPGERNPQEPEPARLPPLPYPVTPEAGDWMICAASYMGPNAPELARQLVLEIRNKHHLPAYTFNYGEQARRRYTQHWENLRRRFPGLPVRRRTVRMPDQVAILIGGYADLESASQDLKRVRGFPLPHLDLGPNKSAYDLMSVAEPDPKLKVMRVKQAPVNPFKNAFTTRNPTLPQQAAAKPKFDPFWKVLNAKEPYSLLKNPKPWTLVIKEYKGSVVVKPEVGSNKILNALGLGKQKTGEGIAVAGRQAYELAKLLRHPSLGFEAYVFHTRTNSIVTVGGFDGLDDPALARMQQRLAKLRFADHNRHDPVGLFRRPMPMEVPREE